jgi:hypothetical protein
VLILPAPAGFFTAPSYPAGSEPWTVAVADFNGDGIPDLALADYDAARTGTGAGVSILLGNGDGSFQAPISYVFGASEPYLAVGDFNGDGHPDLAVAGWDNSGQWTVSVLLGNGDGTFQAPQSMVIPNGPVSLGVGDFNGDGHADLVVGAAHASMVFLGNGDGTFQAPAYVAPGVLAVADLNGDGLLDLIGDGVIVLLGNGDGTFQAAQSYPLGGLNAWSIAVADLNGDGIPDLAVAFNGYGFGLDCGLSILLGNGDGSFQAPHSSLLGTQIGLGALAVGDLNGDGHPDLVLADESSVFIFLGHGDGTFQAPVQYAANGFPVAAAVGDWNGDGILDVAVATPGSNTVTILLGRGDGSFAAARSYWSSPAAGPATTSIAAGDFNGDGIPDLVVANAADDFVNILLGNGDGTFQAPQRYPAVWPAWRLHVADFNGDGSLDVAGVATDPASGNGLVFIVLGNGDGSFQDPLTFAAGNGPNFLAVGDFNGDGNLDLVTTNFYAEGDFRHPPIIIENDVRVLLGNGDGTFQPAQAYALNPNYSKPMAVGVGDFNGDGMLDLAVANNDANVVSILLGNGDGTFQPARNHALGVNPAWLVVGDFNGDGHLDLAVACAGTYSDPGGVTILLGKGDGTFQRARTIPAGVNPLCVAVADFNRDGFLDLAVTDGLQLLLLLGNGDGTFQPAQNYAAGSGGSLVVADFNGDGRPDVALSDSATILLNQP